MRYFLFLALVGCVAYRAAPLDLEQLEAGLQGDATGPLDYAAAVRAADERNPRLRELAAEARAAGLDVPATGVDFGPNQELSRLGLTFDPLGVSGTGPRGAAERAAEERRLAVLARLFEERRRIAADIAEVFATERALLEQGPPALAVDADRFLQAGLAAPAAAGHVRHARAAAAAETQAIASLRAANVARLRRLLALAPDAPVVLDALDLPPAPSCDSARLLQRPDLAVALARYRVADAEFRQAVREQWPTLQLGASIGVDGGGLKPFAALAIPVGASRRARAAGARREAARHAAESELLRAQEEAALRAAERDAARAREAAAASAASASRATLTAALARLEIEPDAFPGVAEAAVGAVADAAQAREAAVALAQAEVRYAAAYAWPLPEDVR